VKEIETGCDGLKWLTLAPPHAITDRGFELKVLLFGLALRASVPLRGRTWGAQHKTSTQRGPGAGILEGGCNLS